jgi:hypothetical protein
MSRLPSPGADADAHFCSGARDVGCGGARCGAAIVATADFPFRARSVRLLSDAVG